MSSESSRHENEYSHRQGSIISVPDEDDQITTASDLLAIQEQEQLFSQPSLSTSSSILSNGYSKIPNLGDSQSFDVEKEYQTASIDLQTISDISNEDNPIQNWKRLSGGASSSDLRFQSVSESTSTDDVTTSFGFQQQDRTDSHEQLNGNLFEQVNHTTDYTTLVQSKQLYFDPNPEFIRKPQMIAPIVYKQNIMVKFLKPPSVPQGPLIIREVRPPQAPPPPPLVSRKSGFLINLSSDIGCSSASSTSSITTANYSSRKTTTSTRTHDK
jgi:hypothetical protein